MPPSSETRLARFGEWDEIRGLAVSGKFGDQRPFFAGSQAYERMDLVRQGINDVRSSRDRYPQFMHELRDLFEVEAVDSSDPKYEDRVAALFSSNKTWLTPADSNRQDDYEALKLYTSALGYRQIFGVINAAFRDDHLLNDRQRLRSAAFLVELLNIDLFNYRTFHDHADNFYGTVYRGMCVSTEELSLFTGAARSPVTERYVSVPLAMVSTSVDRESALTFALAQARRDPDLHLVLWEIQVANLAKELLSLYRTRFPDSVVTSLCAVPTDRLSDYSDEKEVLLRGPFFQILGVTADVVAGYDRPLYTIEAVTLNTNRDHLTAIASNEGADRRMRDVFRTIIVAHRSTLCAERADQLGLAVDAASYRRIADENRAALEDLLEG